MLDVDKLFPFLPWLGLSFLSFLPFCSLTTFLFTGVCHHLRKWYPGQEWLQYENKTQFLHLHAPSLSSARNFSLNLSCRRLLRSGETRWAFYLASLGFRLPSSGAVLQRGRKRGAGGGAGRDRQTPSRDACPPSAFPAGPPEGSRAQATASSRPAEPAGSSTWKGLLGPHRPLRETCERRAGGGSRRGGTCWNPEEISRGVKVRARSQDWGVPPSRK